MKVTLNEPKLNKPQKMLIQAIKKSPIQIEIIVGLAQIIFITILILKLK